MPPKKLASSPVYDLDIEAAKHTFDNVGKAIDRHDFRGAIEFATSAFHQFQQLTVTTLDHRAYALGMQANFDEAIEEERMIVTLAPNVSTGYLRLGQLYQLQGKPRLAIDAYRSGMLKVPRSDKEYRELYRLKTQATTQASKKVDFISRLPTELVYSILGKLGEEPKAACLSVSHMWRTRTIDCSAAWSTLTVFDDNADQCIANVLPHIARHVEELTIDTGSRRFWNRYSWHMQNNYFSNLKSLGLEEATTNQFQTDIPFSMAAAFLQVRDTLTTLSLNFEYHRLPLVTISDVLFACDNLKTLKYTTYRGLSEVLGNISARRKDYILIDLHLKMQETGGPSLGMLLRQCQQIQRLVLEDCEDDDDIVVGLIKRNCPNLRIMGYNSLEEVAPLCSIHAEISSPGLRIIHSTAYGISVENKLGYWSNSNSEKIERTVLRSLSGNTKLTQVRVYCASAVKALADTLTQLPPVKTFRLESTNERQHADTDLKRLFQYYAATQKAATHLSNIALRKCVSITDDVLAALVQVLSLTDILLHDLVQVSSDGLNRFLNNLTSNVSTVELGHWNIVSDYHLHALSGAQGLKKLILSNLTGISDYGIINMVDKTKSLKSLELKNCTTISDKAVEYAKQIVQVEQSPDPIEESEDESENENLDNNE
ncbi:hypothetical protein BJV82DRAFT_702408 [Fennellomyces sp. T-0311]|nr:hypothetical protein BJV82DRAFT_702408 [Fennellomyces sp. T-0311]